MDINVDRIIENASQAVRADGERYIQKVIKRSLTKVLAAQHVLDRCNEDHSNLIATIREGKFDAEAEKWNDIRTGGR